MFINTAWNQTVLQFVLRIRIILHRSLESHTLKSDFSKTEWDVIKRNLEDLTKEAYRQNHGFLHVLITIKRLFHKTPIILKRSYKKGDVYYREFALFILVNYSNASFEQISQEFNIDIHQLEFNKHKEIYENAMKKN